MNSFSYLRVGPHLIHSRRGPTPGACCSARLRFATAQGCHALARLRCPSASSVDSRPRGKAAFAQFTQYLPRRVTAAISTSRWDFPSTARPGLRVDSHCAEDGPDSRPASECAADADGPTT